MEIKSLNLFTLRFPPRLKIVSLVIAILFFWLSNLLLPIGAFEHAKSAVLLRPNDPAAHLELSRAAVEALNWELARSEFDRAFLLLTKQRDPNIFGITSQFEEVQSQVYVERTIHEEISTLKKILEIYPAYRDVYLRISLLYYQLFDDEAASSFWKAARELDPNNVEVLQVGALLEQTI